METRLSRLQNVIGKQLGLEPNDITPDADFGKELGADSLDVFVLVMAIEDESEIVIEVQAATQFSTLQDELDYMEGRWKTH